VHHQILTERVLSVVSSFKSLFCVSSFALLIDYFSALRGQGHPTGNSGPYFGPSQKLDFELEMVSFL
jgi:hypothetical protein